MRIATLNTNQETRFHDAIGDHAAPLDDERDLDTPKPIHLALELTQQK